VPVLSPLALSQHVPLPIAEQIFDLPIAVAEGCPGAANLRRLQADGLQSREKGSSAGQQDAADLHPEKVEKTQVGADRQPLCEGKEGCHCHGHSQ